MAGATVSDGRGPVLLAVTWTWAGVATVLYVLRAINASIAPKDHGSLLGLRWDFVLVTVAYLTALSAEVLLTISVHFGTGNHQSSLSPSQAVNSAFWSWIGQVCAIFALVWGRFAVIAFLVALQGRTYTTWKRVLLIVGAIQFLINTVEVVLILNQCTPTQKLWNQSIPGTCPLIEICSKVGYLQGSIGAFADFFLALYPPAVIIGPLQAMAMRFKIALCLIMGGGVLAGIAGIVKTISIEGILKTDDISYATVNLLTMVMTEVWFIIIFGSLPTLRAVFVTVGHRVISATGGTKSTDKHRTSRFKDESWIELNTKDYESKVDGGRRMVGMTGSLGHGDSEENILPESRHNIMITTETTVRSSSR